MTMPVASPACSKPPRVLSQHQFASTIVYVTFDGEESGLNGSTQYAAAAKARGDTIVGMLELDMIAAPRGNTTQAAVYSYAANQPLRQQIVSALATYGGIVGTEIDNPYPLSDHVPFEEQGYPASLLIEYDPFGNHKHPHAERLRDQPRLHRLRLRHQHGAHRRGLHGRKRRPRARAGNAGAIAAAAVGWGNAPPALEGRISPAIRR